MTDRIDYDGTRSQELAHAARELLQLQLGYLDGALTEREFEAGCERVRERHGIQTNN